MDPIFIFTAALGLGYFGFIIYTANQNETTGTSSTALRWMLYIIAVMVGLYGVSVLQTAMLTNNSPELLAEVGLDLPPISIPGAWVNLFLALITTVLSFRIIRSQVTRERLQRIIGENGTFNPSSIVHLTAAVLALAYLSLTIGQLVMLGGLAGLATELEADSFTIVSLLFNMVLQVGIAFLGVGMAIRRTLSQTMQRLGLRIPTSQDLIAGLVAAAVLYVIAVVVGIIWSLLVTPETLQDQTVAVEQIASMFSTLPLAFLLAATAAVGEEILFRGALQPVFGLVLTSIFFALIHTQYTLTPATIVIFAVSVVLGVVRKRYSTTSAIFAHFFYNFITLSLPIIAGVSSGGSL